MELVRCFKEYRTRTRMNSVHEGKFRDIAAELRQTEAKLNEIPESRRTGVTALPVELWSIIIDTIVKESLGARCPHYPRYCVFPHELYLRLVCRVFDKEILRAFHTHLILPRFPRTSFIRDLARPDIAKRFDLSLRNALLGSALYNSSISKSAMPSKKRSSGRHFDMLNRIENCTRIAQQIDQDDSESHAQDLTRMFCIAASTSRYCWMHIFYAYTTGCFRSRKVKYTTPRDNAYLEAALLVASGYKIAEVKECMAKLPKTKFAQVFWYEERIYVHKHLEEYLDGRRYRMN